MHSVPDSFWQWLSSLRSDDLCALIAVISVFGVVAIGIVCATVYKIHKTRTEDALKRELLDRGMSAEEIATIVGAKPSKARFQRLTRS
jgi:hypothetical protein